MGKDGLPDIMKGRDRAGTPGIQLIPVKAKMRRKTGKAGVNTDNRSIGNTMRNSIRIPNIPDLTITAANPAVNPQT